MCVQVVIVKPEESLSMYGRKVEPTSRPTE
jgi:hypothetical protein